MCEICKITNKKLFNRIDNLLLQNGGMLMEIDKRELKEAFVEEELFIDSLSDAVLENHYKEQQTKIRAARPYTDEDEKERSSLTEDIGKDEAEILYGVISKQASTFTKLTEKIDSAVEGAVAEDFFTTIHSGTLELYKEVSSSIRKNVQLLGEINAAINGSKSGAMEGLMALAKALTPSPAKTGDLTTDEYD